MLIWIHLTVETPDAARMQRQEEWRGTVPWQPILAYTLQPRDEVTIGPHRATVTHREFNIRDERDGNVEAITVHLRLVLPHGQWGTLHRAVKRLRLTLAKPMLYWDSQPKRKKR